MIYSGIKTEWGGIFAPKHWLLGPGTIHPLMGLGIGGGGGGILTDFYMERCVFHGYQWRHLRFRVPPYLLSRGVGLVVGANGGAAFSAWCIYWCDERSQLVHSSLLVTIRLRFTCGERKIW